MVVRILIGDCRDVLRTLPDESVHCVVTSPPYWGLRDYGVAGQIGLEASYADYIDGMVDVFRDVRRVLRADGTLWLNLGDCYATGAGKVGEHPGGGAQGARWKGGPPSDKSTLRGNGHVGGGPKLQSLAPVANRGVHTAEHSGKQAYRIEQMGPMTQPNRMPQPGVKAKDRMMMQARVAIALCDDGWWLRDEIIWHKPNPMPSSVTDRTTCAHEMVYLFSRSRRYYYDGDAIREPFAESSIARLMQPTIGHQRGGEKQDQFEAVGINARNGSRRPNEIVAGLAQRITRKPAGWDTAEGSHSTLRHTAPTKRSGNKERKLGVDRGRPDSHVGGSVPWEGTTRNKRSVWTIATEPFPEAHFATFPAALIEPCILAGCPEGGTVLDPFGGAGTTGLVADRLGRNAILIELNPEYAAMAERRIRGDAPLFVDIGSAEAIPCP